MPASKARKAARDRQIRAAKAESDRLQEVDQPSAENEDARNQNDGGSDDIDFSSAPAQTKSSSKDPSKSKSSKSKKPKSKPKPSKPENDEAGDCDEAAEPTEKKVRFIVFVGNLPYTATTELIKRHFAKLQPKAIRHLTKKGTQQSKGCAFLEFERYDQMKECLKLYHNSSFDDGKPGEKRKINIELTVGGGGGKSRDRKEKLRAKNDRLAEQRKRRAETKREEGGGPPKGKPKPPPPTLPDSEQADIHPSRRTRVHA